MRSLNPYLMSLGETTRKSIADMLSDVYLNPTAIQLRAIDPYVPIQQEPISDYSEINPFDINIPMLRVARANSKIWSAIDSIEQDVSSLAAITDGMTELIASALSRSEDVLDSLNEMVSTGNTFDTVYAEHFDNVQTTETGESRALVINGKLTVDTHEVASFPLNFSLGVSSEEPDVVTSDSTNNTVVVSCSKKAKTKPVVATVVGVLPSPAIVNTIRVAPISGKIISVAAITSEGKKLELENKSRNDKWLSMVENVSIVAIHVTLESTEESDALAANDVIAAESAKRFKKLIRSQVFARETTDVSPRRKKIARPSRKTEHANARILSLRNRRQRGADENARSSILSCEASVSIMEHDKLGEWRSKPVVIEGDISDFSISVMETLPDGCATQWFAAVSGSQWIPIHPRNEPYVTNEPLQLDSSGKAYFRFKADPSEIIITPLNGETEATVSWLYAPDGNVSGVIYTGDRNSPVMASYKPIDAVTLDPERYGISTGAGQIVDVVTNGVPGETIEVNESSCVLSHIPYLVLEPVPNMAVYADGIKINIINDGDSLASYKNTVCKVTGKTIRFNKPVGTITVYYKYIRMNVRLRAVLVSVIADSGHVPMVDTVLYEVKHS